MKNPKLITKPFAQNGQKNAIPENYSSSMESNQATWDQGFGQITMIPVAAGGLPPKGQDFNGIFNQISENVVYLSKGGRFKFSADYAAAINGYPKGAILQSDDETKEYQSLVDNNKVNFNTATQAQVNAVWKLFSTDDIFAQIDGKQPKGDYIKLGEYGVGTKSSTQLTKYAKNWGTNGFWIGELENGVTMAMGVSVNHINGAYGFNFYARNSKIYYTCTENGVKSQELQIWTENNFNPLDYALLDDMNIELSKKQPVGNYIKLGEFGIGTGSSPSLTTYAKDWNRNGFYRGSLNNTSSVVFGISCNHMDGLYALNIYGRGGRVFFSTRENGADSVVDGTFHTSANTTTDRNGYLRSSTSTVEMQAVPIGSSIIWNSTAPIPDNFWPNEGRSFSASEYPELAKILPSLKLPDDRGYAIRIADNGKGIDAGRTVGTYQDCAIENIVGEIHANIPGSASGVFSYRANGSRAEGSAPTGGSWIFDASTQVRTANETRMKNVAKILITRVK